MADAVVSAGRAPAPTWICDSKAGRYLRPVSNVYRWTALFYSGRVTQFHQRT